MIEFIFDSWLTENGMLIRYDKLEHAVLFLVAIYYGAKYFGWHLYKQSAAWFVLGVLNEIKDALLDYRVYGWIGGEGFSVPDLGANVIGILVGCYLVVRKSKKIQSWMEV